MSSVRHFLLVATAAVTVGGCLPIEGDLDEYSRDWQPADVNAETDVDTSALQDDPPLPEPGDGETPGGGPSTPGTDGNPDDPTLSNPDSTDGSSGSGVPPVDPSTDETPDETPPPPPLPNPCPDGIANGFGTTCYFVSTETATWAAARTACQTWGGDLVMMDAPFEDNFVATLANESVWIGGNDIAFDNNFVWADGRPLPLPPQGNWGAAQPDAFPGADCIEKRQEPFERWYDQPCDAPLRFVCEKPATQPAAQ
jgi:lectin-like protein